MKKNNTIPVCRPVITALEREYVNDCLDSGWIGSGGPYVSLFEQEFSSLHGADYGVACSNGTTALHLAIKALGLGLGDEIIMPDFCIISIANAAIYCGATPVFVDAELKTWNMDLDKVEEAITPQTKAILVVHTYGCPIDMDRVMDIAHRNHLFVIEDCAEAHGASYKGFSVGGIGDIGCFSFFPNKIITTGEGGMCVTNNQSLAENIRYYSNLCFDEPRFIHKDIGFNYRLTNLQASIGCAQLINFQDLFKQRIINANKYRALLKDVPGVVMPPTIDYGVNVYWMFGILVEPESGMTKESLMTALAEEGIETRSFFYPLHAQPAFAHQPRLDNNLYPNSISLYNKGLYLPSSSDLSDEEIFRVVEVIKAHAQKNS